MVPHMGKVKLVGLEECSHFIKSLASMRSFNMANTYSEYLKSRNGAF